MFLRFLPEGGDEIIRDTLGCLRHIACQEETDRYIPKDLMGGVYDTWAQARNDIHKEWAFSTDPANLQPRVRPLFRRVAEHIRRYPPQGIVQGNLDRAIDSVEAPWGGRIERELRTIIDEEGGDPWAVSLRLYEKVGDLGLEPFKPPDPLPIIDEEEIALVCWMLVDTEEG